MAAGGESQLVLWAMRWLLEVGLLAGSEEHVLVWIRDRDRAACLCRAFHRDGLAADWAASLPEAIALLDRVFPRAVACTLQDDSPSLIDLETLLAYQAIGHGSVSLPPIPIWALSPDPASHAPHIENLEIPVYLSPAEVGLEGLAAEVVSCLAREAWSPMMQAAEPVQVLYLSADARVGFYQSRYLTSRGLPTLAVDTPAKALDLLAEQPFGAMVADLPDEFAGRQLLSDAAARWPSMPIVVHGASEGWLSQLPPSDLPRNLVGVLAHPVKAQAVEATLRRLLRIPPTRRNGRRRQPASEQDFPPPGN